MGCWQRAFIILFAALLTGCAKDLYLENPSLDDITQVLIDGVNVPRSAVPSGHTLLLAGVGCRHKLRVTYIDGATQDVDTVPPPLGGFCSTTLRHGRFMRDPILQFDRGG